MRIALKLAALPRITGLSLRRRLRLLRSRRALRNLDADQLRDVGLTSAEALREARRPAWDAPASWRL